MIVVVCYKKPTDKDTDARLIFLIFLNFTLKPCFFSDFMLQCLRLRQIIYNNDRITMQLEFLKKCFTDCNYPSKMLSNITKKVASLERDQNMILVPWSLKNQTLLKKYQLS